jgi:hypothetical protein
VKDPVTEGLPDWAAATAQRIVFLSRRRRDMRAELDATLALLAEARPDPALNRYLHACLDLLAQATASRPDLVGMSAELGALCDLARAEIDGDCDDRAVNAYARTLSGCPGAAGVAAMVPGRVVWLGAMAAQVPDEVGAAAVMLVNDMAAVDPMLPLHALRAAAPGRA